MVVQNNIAALNSHRILGNNNAALSGNLEKLSSGYRINRAADDAAGLAISEKMKSQIKGLEAAEKNANDGISLVQTAEGALSEVHSMLNRMTYLATQAANGTYADEERAKLQLEVTSLSEEIDRISQSTTFNGIDLLQGGTDPKDAASPSSISGASNIAATIEDGDTATVYEADFAFSGVGTDGTDTTITVKGTDEVKVSVIVKGDAKISSTVAAAATTGTTNPTYEVTLNSGSSAVGKMTVVNTNGDISITIEVNSGATVTSTQLNAALTELKALDGASTSAATIAGSTTDLSSITSISMDGDIDGAKAPTSPVTETGNLKEVTDPTSSSGTITLQVGDTADSWQQVEITVYNTDTTSLGIDDVDISSLEGAQEAIDKINDAIDMVSAVRSRFGAIQNRLDHTINNIGATTENLQAAESRIRDTDMAEEMMLYTKNNILVQSAQSMLAQANQVPQGVLQLLQ